MNCPECGNNEIYEQGTLLYRTRILEWDGNTAVVHDEHSEILYDTSEADCFWCGSCTLEFEPTPEG